jgi:hypothetical protein
VEPDYLPDSEVFFFSAMFIPHEVFTPHKYVHSSTWGVQRGVTPSAGFGGDIPPTWGSKSKWAPSGGSGAKPPKEKLPCKCIL